MDDLLNTAPCGFLSFTDDGRIVLANDALSELLGYERGELLKRHCEALLQRAEARIQTITLDPAGRAVGTAPLDVD